DQLAAAEGRMKWAPNKKLHFDVAVIKAIQTLNQVTLNEVIENLAALRDGKESGGRDSVEPQRAPGKSPAKPADSPNPETSRVAEKPPTAEPKTAALEPSQIDYKE